MKDLNESGLFGTVREPGGCSCETPAPDDDAPCCGARPRPPSGPMERPGYMLCPFVEGFLDTPAGPVPRVATRLSWRDRLGTIGVRLNIGRHRYAVAPGLYGVGRPGPDSPVLVTANYKLSFDALRRELAGPDAWLLVADTRGINVWCAAGKGLFSAAEIVRQVARTGLAKVVRHRELILPQLSATGVRALDVQRGCGFTAGFGPIRSRDVRDFLAAGRTASEPMRRVTFGLGERIVLVPVEVALALKPLLWTLVAAFVLSGLGPGLFSFGAAWTRGLLFMAATLAGILAGAVAVPLLLPWLPGRAFALKGLWPGLAAGAVAALGSAGTPASLSGPALVLWTAAVSSYLAMNFTGATPYTSPSGVEKEMRASLPLQAAAALLAVGLWIGGAFAAP